MHRPITTAVLLLLLAVPGLKAQDSAPDTTENKLIRFFRDFGRVGFRYGKGYWTNRLFHRREFYQPIQLIPLELSYGLITLVSDIPANLEIDIDSNYYFRCKDVQHLKDKLIQLWHSDFTNDDREQLINLVRNKYNWQQIAAQTIEVYRTALKD